MKNRDYRNSLEIQSQSEGNERKLELLKDVLQNGSFLPKPLLHKDIDEAFKEWVDKDLKMVSDDGVILPTMTLFSNQRFSEYSQSWQYVDENKNLILNFKTVTREPNPKEGSIQGGLWNIPGEQWFSMKRQIVLDDNGGESILLLKMKQPIALDFKYKISVFTTKYEKINEFNTIINDKFKARQCYIWPNNHPIPMILDSISDESSYQIDDRQFYCQTYQIKAEGYIIPEDFYKVEEIPLKVGFGFGNMPNKSKLKADVEIEEEGNNVILTLIFQNGVKIAKFTNDCDFYVPTNDISLSNIYDNFKIYVNDEEIDIKATELYFKDGDNIKIKVNKIRENNFATMILNGHK